ncbi:TolC family protein [Caenimonas koreensis DSM 17982]|uniref:TolC family protein n=1 Tax=Caenimonas koreensis DSM 17982 TaxID=1121255 RepID=A0A844B7P2_9BURK|nr:TolC family protein [Caenimonas koreensis]MRD47527.1 TolC family protein [Caenimonas koreensis DSM 17982]
MRRKTLAFAGALILACAPGMAQTNSSGVTAAAPSAPLTLLEALARATHANAQVRAKQAQLVAAQGMHADAQALLFNNPQLSLESTRRDVPLSPAGTERQKEWTGGLSQAFETGGQAGYRREASSAALDALRFEIADIRAQVRSEVTTLFFRALALQEKVELESQALKLFDDAAVAVQKRRRAGEDTKLDANVALVEAERARNQLAVAQEQLLDVRRELAARLQVSPSPSMRVMGQLTPTALPYTRGDLMANLDAQPRLLALGLRERSAKARLGLEKASVMPDITVGVNVGREGPAYARERLTTVTVSVPLPLFRRNAAGIGQASTDATQATIERDSVTLDTQASISSLWAKLTSQEQRVRRLEQLVVPALTENLNLSAKSRQAGQIGLLEVIVVNRQALDARRDLIEALSDYHATRAALELAAGWPRENQP